jgi:two-component system phosphate regulon sensor histidine kinase PhoR
VRVTAYGDGERLLLAQDVTERLRTEQIRKDFVGNVSHELRTPLTVISGFVENMQADNDSMPVQWRKPLDLIAGQAERMRQIVEDLLLLARLESASAEAPRDPVDPAEMLESIARDGRSLATEQQKIQVSIESDAWLLGDGGLLRSAVTNLMVNAIHHTPHGGQITLALQETPEGLSILVQDTGEGIAAKHIPRLTERFYRVDAGRSRERGGTGLGLAIVKHALQKHGAKLKIESRVGEGSRFACIFPADRRQ